MKKWKVEVDETVWAVNTYIIEADSEITIEIDIMEGNREGILKQIKTFSDTRTITNIRSIMPIPEAAEDDPSSKLC